MAEFNSKGEPLVSVVRVIEYHGTQKWIQGVLQASRIPVYGVCKISPENGKALPEGCEIKSGIVEWNIITGAGEEPARDVIPIPPGSSSGQTH